MNRQEIPQMVLTSNGYDGATVMSTKYKQSIDGLSSLELQVIVTIDTTVYVKEENIIGFFDKQASSSGEWKFFVIKEITYYDDDENKRIMDVYCEDYAYELMDSVCDVELKDNSYSVLSKITTVLSTTRWGVSQTTPPDDPTHIKFPKETKNKSVLEVLQIIAKEYNLHLKFEIQYFDGAIQKRSVTMKSVIGQDNGFTFDYNFNIDSIERTVDSSNIKTAIIPVGGVPEDSPKDTPPIDIKGVVWTTPSNPENKPLGQAWLEDTVATSQWGFSSPSGVVLPRYVYYQNDEITNPAELIQDAWNQLQNINAPILNYKMKIIDLFALSGYDYTKEASNVVRVGDIVNVIDRTFLFNHVVTTTVISRELDLLDPSTTVLELGNFIKSIVSTTSSLSNLSNSSGSLMKVTAEVGQLQNNLSVLGGEVVVAQTAMIGTARIDNASITTAKIADASITNAKIDRVSANKLVVATADIQDASITNAKIDRASANKLVVGTADIANASITNAKIDRATANKLVVVTADIADASITNAKIDRASVNKLVVTTADIANASITNAKIDRATANKLVVTSADIQDATITNAKIDRATANKLVVTTADIATGSITNALIGTGAVQTAQIADGSITDAKIVGLTASKITAGTIDAGVITVNNLNANNITTGTINGQYIAGGAIDSTKLATALNTTINTASTNASTALTNAQTAQTTADGKNTVFYATTAPSTTGRKVGDTWFDTDDGNKMYQWNGTAWTATQFGTNAIANASITNALIADATIQSAKIASLDAGKVTTGTLSASVIGAGSISSDKIASGAITTSLLSANAVTADKISANTITGDRLVVDSITAREIASKTITANEIVANTITASEIASNTITANQIASGTITANQIASNTITADKITVANWNNFSELNRANLWGNFTASYDTTYTYETWYTMNTLVRDTVISKKYSCNGGESFRIKFDLTTSVQGASVSGGASDGYKNVNVGLYGRLRDGSYFYNVPTGGMNCTNLAVNTMTTLPSTAVEFWVAVQIAGLSPFSGTVKISDIMVQQMNTGELVVDGSLTANKINGGTLTLGGSSNTKGLFSLQNASGTEVVRMDNTGLTIKNGNINILNNAGTTQLSADSSGNLNFQGKLTATVTATGASLTIDGGGIALYNATQGTTYRIQGDRFGTTSFCSNYIDYTSSTATLSSNTNFSKGFYSYGKVVTQWFSLSIPALAIDAVASFDNLAITDASGKDLRFIGFVNASTTAQELYPTVVNWTSTTAGCVETVNLRIRNISGVSQVTRTARVCVMFVGLN